MIHLDTHVLVWLLEGRAELGRRARAFVEGTGARHRVAVSAISFWELAMLAAKRRLSLGTRTPEAYRLRVLRLGIEETPIDGSIGIRATALAGLHGDPADRMIVATALQHGSTLVTGDDRILRWKGPLERLDARK